jgi:hypothetical protein
VILSPFFVLEKVLPDNIVVFVSWLEKDWLTGLKSFVVPRLVVVVLVTGFMQAYPMIWTLHPGTGQCMIGLLLRLVYKRAIHSEHRK